MNSRYCEDCGVLKGNSGICSNCYEELYIFELNKYRNRNEWIDFPLSDEWMGIVTEQRRSLSKDKLK